MGNTRRKRSIHIGIDKYEDPAITDLPFCTADARLLASFFRDVAGYESVSVLADSTRNSILDAVTGEIAHLSPGDLLVMSCSGHGFQTDGRFLFGASDSRMQFIQEGVDGVPLAMLKRLVHSKGCDCAFFIDACSRPGLGTREISVYKPSTELPERDLVLFEDTDGPGFGIMMPEVAQEVCALGHGLFTAALDRALREAYEQGRSTMYDVYTCVNEHAKAICQDNGIQCSQFSITYSGRPISLW